MINRKPSKCFLYQVYQVRLETCRIGSASLAIPTLVLVLPDKFEIKNTNMRCSTLNIFRKKIAHQLSRNVRQDISKPYTCPALRYRPAFTATRYRVRHEIKGSLVRSKAGSFYFLDSKIFYI